MLPSSLKTTDLISNSKITPIIQKYAPQIEAYFRDLIDNRNIVEETLESIEPLQEQLIPGSNKENTKEYWRHTGYPGGQKTVSYKKMIDERPDRVIMSAVKGMLHHNKLGRKLLKHLKVYSGSNHPHEAQSPKELSIN